MNKWIEVGVFSFTYRCLGTNIKAGPIRRLTDVVALIRFGQIGQFQVGLVLRVAADTFGD